MVELGKDTGMEYRYLGNSGLKVSVLSYGNMTARDNPESRDFQKAVVKRCLEAGINFFDTAEYYQLGYAEKDLGRVFKELNVKREDIVVTTKIFKIGDGVNDGFLSRKHIIEGLTNSLKRLQLDYVDIVYCHRPDYEVSLEETVGAMNWCIESGKAFYWGTSEWPADRIAKAMEMCEAKGWHKPIVDQCEYSMLIREKMEKEYRRLFSEYRYGTTIWSPIAGGILAGKYNDGSAPDGTRYTSDPNPIYQMIWMKYFSPDKKETRVK